MVRHHYTALLAAIFLAFTPGWQYLLEFLSYEHILHFPDAETDSSWDVASVQAANPAVRVHHCY